MRICRDLIREYVFERPILGIDDASQVAWRHLGMDMFDKVSLDEIRFFVSTVIGKGEVHVGLGHAIDGTTEINLRF